MYANFKFLHYMTRALDQKQFNNDYIENKSITMMRGKSPPPEHNNIHVIENYKYNQLRVSVYVKYIQC